MENVAQETEKAISGAIKVDEKEIRDHLDGLVRQSVEDTLNALLNAEADAICHAGRYQRTPDRLDTRAGTYSRKLLTKAGEVELKVPSFEDASDHRTRTLGCEHDDIGILRGFDEIVDYRESVCELQCGSLLHVRSYLALIDVGLRLIREHHHHDVRIFYGIGDGCDLHTVLFGLVERFPGPYTDRDVQSGIAVAERLRPSLGTVAQNGNLLALQNP